MIIVFTAARTLSGMFLAFLQQPAKFFTNTKPNFHAPECSDTEIQPKRESIPEKTFAVIAIAIAICRVIQIKLNQVI